MKKIGSFVALVIVLAAAFWVYRTRQNVKHVMRYEQAVSKSLAAQGLSNETNLALAIIYTETKGRDTDVMQSSESINGKTGEIVTQSESIDQGIANLTKVLNYAASKKVDPWAGVQAYNYGKNYVDYVAKQGGTNSLDLAKAYSRDVVAPSLGNKTGQTYYHLTLYSLLNNGGKLYTNGGNMFYAQEVKYHMALLRLFNW
ncbi:lysozyme family protein [Lactococcus termiticola]|uniref:CwlT-like lysozyme domain-containing protein n=1 Tax=Lactococcus termiticola TaxID=2169526 RepID=A0A2R5HKD1_9LACT|nr:lysozyme family protein [Lactococcus termiticola]GBG96981.1 hypothetical protein NtB2_01118 [Lactococcus termiticola]